MTRYLAPNPMNNLLSYRTILQFLLLYLNFSSSVYMNNIMAERLWRTVKYERRYTSGNTKLYKSLSKASENILSFTTTKGPAKPSGEGLRQRFYRGSLELRKAA